MGTIWNQFTRRFFFTPITRTHTAHARYGYSNHSCCSDGVLATPMKIYLVLVLASPTNVSKTKLFLPFLFTDINISFAAWIAISMGAGLILSMFGGRAYMEYKTRGERKEVKQMLEESWTKKSFKRNGKSRLD